MTQQYNLKCAGVKRLMKEAMELREPTEMYYAQPLEDNLFEWHFTVRGTIGTDFDGGIYHGRILFPPEYPMKPPNMIILTPNGRFELNKKICLSISGYHPETWLPSWSIRTALLALIGFMPTAGGGALGSLDYPPEERRKLAKMSAFWKCNHCQVLMKDVLLPITEDGARKDAEEAKSLAEQLKFQDESDVKKSVEESKAEEGKVCEEPEQAESTEISEAPPTPSTISETIDEPASQSAVEPVAELAQLPRAQEVPIIPPSERRLRSSQSCDYSLFVSIPICVFALSIFIVLLSRRILLIQ
ncbi:unnamed protein product [Caenorhabditis bovis]|uniref:UBC core domain-containing protein n=1 Tax=Caenorhabditis bovis TaxID=2654633 RepID=A0A8S1FEG5_9PELO|nr:unnamed protein product [Caenorhabditis bovis]